MNERIVKLLRQIEWRGHADIGVWTCPCCARRGRVREDSEWYQGHSETCELNNIMNELDVA